MSRRSRKTRSRRRSSYIRHDSPNLRRPRRQRRTTYAARFDPPPVRFAYQFDDTRRRAFVTTPHPPPPAVQRRRAGIYVTNQEARQIQRTRANRLEDSFKAQKAYDRCRKNKEYKKDMMRKLAAQTGSKRDLQKWRENRRRSIDKRC